MMHPDSSASLPIESVLDDIRLQLHKNPTLLLIAEPGAGKTTRVPLALVQQDWLGDKMIVMLEPRRLAARNAAKYMASQLGENIGETVGYRIRLENRSSEKTRILVVTEGILTRMLQSDPELTGVGLVIFDEFHERSLNSDLGLAFCLEVVETLRDDLLLVAMSATLDAGPVAALMNAPIVTSAGRAYPVETRWLDRPLPAQAHKLDSLIDLVVRAEAETRTMGGDILVFLPGEGEIRRALAALTTRLPQDCQPEALFGAMPFEAQQAVLRPAEHGRKLVLATAIAETSLT